MEKLKTVLTDITLFVFAFSFMYLKTQVDILKEDNAYIIEQVKRLDDNVVAIEGVLEDQHTINDELANRLGNYSDNVQAVNELLTTLKEKYGVE